MPNTDVPGSNKVIIRDETTQSGAIQRTITLNRPEKRNALDLQTIETITTAIATAKDRTLLINAANPAFCAGLDLTEIVAKGSPQEHLRSLVALLVALANHQKPTTCYAQGPARAGGVALACCADHVIATADATFMIPGEQVYQPMASILSPILAARRNLQIETADTLRGTLLSANDAKAIGLIDEVLETQQYQDTRQDQDTKQEMTTAIDRTNPKAQSTKSRSTAITPAVINEVNARIDRAVKPDAIAPLIEHLRKQYARPS